MIGNLGETLGGGKGISLDLGILQLSVTLSITGIQSLSDALQQSLQQPQEVLQENVAKVIDAVQQLGVDDLRKWAEQGGQEQKDVFNQLVSQLQNAASRGQQKAQELVQSLGGKIAEAGQKMQSAANKEGETRH